MAYMGFSVTKAKIKPSHRDVIANDLLKDLSTNFKEQYEKVDYSKYK